MLLSIPIEAASLLLLLFLRLFFGNSDIYYYCLYDTIVAAVNFYILIRIFKFCLNIKVISSQVRGLLFSLVLSFSIFVSILGIAYFMGYFDQNTTLKLSIKLSITASIAIAFGLMKFYDLKLSKNYGAVYVILQILDILCIITLLTVAIAIRPITLIKINGFGWIVAGLITLDTVIEAVVERKLNYWYYKKVLLAKFKILVITKTYDKVLTAPFDREVTGDYILDDCRYILDRSIISRYRSLSNLCRTYLKVSLKNNIDRETTIEYTSNLYKLLMLNLMKRSLDFVNVPNFIKEPTQNFIRRGKKKKLDKSI